MKKEKIQKERMLAVGLCDPNPTRGRTFILTDGRSEEERPIEKKKEADLFRALSKAIIPCACDD